MVCHSNIRTRKHIKGNYDSEIKLSAITINILHVLHITCFVELIVNDVDRKGYT